MITAKTKLCGIFGYPVEHSLSPLMHNAGFRHLGLDYVYLAFNVPPEELADAVKTIRTLGITGVNVTIPHKEKVIPYLDRITPQARAIGAVNTIINVNGMLVGENTDGLGFLRSLKEENKVNPKNKNILLLGAGGAGRALGVTLLGQGVKKFYLFDVIEKKAEMLAKELDDGKVIVINREDIKKCIAATHILINASPVGMKDGDPCVIEPSLLHKDLFVYDVIYNCVTCLLKEARKRKIKCADGLGMLVGQGAQSFELWTGKKAPIAIMKRTLKERVYAAISHKR